MRPTYGLAAYRCGDYLDGKGWRHDPANKEMGAAVAAFVAATGVGLDSPIIIESAGSTVNGFGELAWKILKALWKFLQVLSPLIAAVALYLAYRTDKALRVVEPAMREIERNLTTRYLGPFPTFMDQIVAILDSAVDSIFIACDLPGYAIFSSHENYVAYRAALETEAGQRIGIRMVVLDEERRDSILQIQFGGRDFAELKASDSFQQFLRWSGRDSRKIRDRRDFILAMEEEERLALKEHFRSLDRREHHSNMPVYVWIVGDKVAVFSIPTLAPGAREAGFVTRDGRLIAELRSVFNTYWKESSPPREH